MQSVWGLRNIARIQLPLWHDFVNPSIAEIAATDFALGSRAPSRDTLLYATVWLADKWPIH